MNNNEEPLPILECEVCDAIITFKNGKSPGIDNIPSELLKHGGKSLIKIFTDITSTNMENYKVIRPIEKII